MWMIKGNSVSLSALQSPHMLMDCPQKVGRPLQVSADRVTIPENVPDGGTGIMTANVNLEPNPNACTIGGMLR